MHLPNQAETAPGPEMPPGANAELADHFPLHHGENRKTGQKLNPRITCLSVSCGQNRPRNGRSKSLPDRIPDEQKSYVDVVRRKTSSLRARKPESHAFNDGSHQIYRRKKASVGGDDNCDSSVRGVAGDETPDVLP